MSKETSLLDSYYMPPLKAICPGTERELISAVWGDVTLKDYAKAKIYEKGLHKIKKPDYTLARLDIEGRAFFDDQWELVKKNYDHYVDIAVFRYKNGSKVLNVKPLKEEEKEDYRIWKERHTKS